MDKCVHVCLNGHVSISRQWVSKNEFCERCGSKIIDKCPTCGCAIREWNYNGMVVVGTPNYQRAAYCKNCGNPYPWTQAALDAAAELVEEEVELDEAKKRKLIASLPDIITETPKTRVAVARLKNALIAAGKFTADGLRQFVIDFGCELAKKQFGI